MSCPFQHLFDLALNRDLVTWEEMTEQDLLRLLQPESTLPDDIWIHILSYLKLPTIVNFTQTDRFYNSDLFWNNLCKTHFGVSHENAKVKYMVEYYRKDLISSNFFNAIHGLERMAYIGFHPYSGKKKRTPKDLGLMHFKDLFRRIDEETKSSEDAYTVMERIFFMVDSITCSRENIQETFRSMGISCLIKDFMGIIIASFMERRKKGFDIKKKQWNRDDPVLDVFMT